MNTSKKTARIVGVLFILGTVSGIVGGVVLIGPSLADPDYLKAFSANESQIILGSLFVLIMGFALTMVPVLLYPIFKKYNEALALGAVIFRGALEAVTYIATATSLLLLLSLSREYVNAGAGDASNYQTLGALLLEAGVWIEYMLAFVFSLGAMMIYYIFYQSRLIPRWLSGWGLIGAVIYIAEPLLAMFGTEMEILFAPLALQEMVMAVWLIVKGFNSTAIVTESAKETL